MMNIANNHVLFYGRVCGGLYTKDWTYCIYYFWGDTFVHTAYTVQWYPQLHNGQDIINLMLAVLNSYWRNQFNINWLTSNLHNNLRIMSFLHTLLLSFLHSTLPCFLPSFLTWCQLPHAAFCEKVYFRHSSHNQSILCVLVRSLACVQILAPFREGALLPVSYKILHRFTANRRNSN